MLLAVLTHIQRLNLFSIELANFTKANITGTSTRTPTTVVSVAPDTSPNRDIETATDSSKKLDAPIMPHGAAIEYGSFAKYAMKNVIANINKV